MSWARICAVMVLLSTTCARNPGDLRSRIQSRQAASLNDSAGSTDRLSSQRNRTYISLRDPTDPIDIQGPRGWEKYSGTFYNYGNELRSGVMDCEDFMIEIVDKLKDEREKADVRPESLYPQNEFKIERYMRQSLTRAKWKYEEADPSSYRDITVAAVIMGLWCLQWGPDGSVVPSTKMTLYFDQGRPQVPRERLGVISLQNLHDVDAFSK